MAVAFSVLADSKVRVRKASVAHEEFTLQWNA